VKSSSDRTACSGECRIVRKRSSQWERRTIPPTLKAEQGDDKVNTAFELDAALARSYGCAVLAAACCQSLPDHNGPPNIGGRVTVEEAIDLIGKGMPTPVRGTWADFGAGRGIFTEALAALLGPEGTVIAIDRDPNLVGQLRHLALRTRGAKIEVATGDVQDFAAIPALQRVTLAGAVFGNVLHYMNEPETVLANVRKYLEPGAPIIVIEYDRRSASRWVPRPLPPNELAVVARTAGLQEPIEIGRRRSRYQGELYCAVTHA
jgi:SAM-dependent methyltransferase